MKTVLITGANRGIGLELARQCQKRGDRVIAVCRKASPALSQLAVQVIEGVDVTSNDGVQSLAGHLGDTAVDVVINNAGILRGGGLERLDFEAIREQFEVNSIGPLRVTAALCDRIPQGGKVAIITSRMGSIDDNTSGGYYGYRMSKAAVNMAGMSLARDLKSKAIAVAILHPGMVRTDMTGGNGMVDAPDAAAGLLARIDELTMEQTGGFWHANGERLPW